MNLKKVVAEKATEYIKDGMTIGLGTGSTAYWATLKIGQLVKEGFSIKGVPTSKQTEELAIELVIPLVDVNSVDKIDITIDGADEVDSKKTLIKGGGGALLREKLIASITEYYIIVVDHSKKVDVLGKFALPVEVTQFGHQVTEKQLKQFGCIPNLREQDGSVFITDNGNYIYDCQFGPVIDEASKLAAKVNDLPGVVENGLFVDMADLVLYSNVEGLVKSIT